MHSFQPSRGRIFFEALCALGIAASLGLASQQTGATALLAGSAAAALFGLSHAFGMRRSAADAVAPQLIDFAPAERDNSIACPADETPMSAEPPAELARPVVTREPVEQAVSQPKKARQAKTARKTASGARGSRKEAKVPELVSSEPAALPEIVQPEEAAVSLYEELDQPRIEPLFEPETHFRQHRAVFGRKAG